MNTIENILEEMSKQHIQANLLIMKANEGYSCVMVPPGVYVKHFLMEHHYNGSTVLNAAHQAWMDSQTEKEKP